MRSKHVPWDAAGYTSRCYRSPKARVVHAPVGPEFRPPDVPAQKCCGYVVCHCGHATGKIGGLNSVVRGIPHSIQLCSGGCDRRIPAGQVTCFDCEQRGQLNRAAIMAQQEAYDRTSYQREQLMQQMRAQDRAREHLRSFADSVKRNFGQTQNGQSPISQMSDRQRLEHLSARIKTHKGVLDPSKFPQVAVDNNSIVAGLDYE